MKTCSKCGGDVEQLISPPAIQFKGSGWYVTDYAHRSSEPAPRNAHNGTSKNGGTDVKAESAKSGTKAESKSAESGSKDKK